MIYIEKKECFLSWMDVLAMAFTIARHSEFHWWTGHVRGVSGCPGACMQASCGFLTRWP